MAKNISANKIEQYLKKPFSNITIAVISPIIAFAIKNPSAKATRLSSVKTSK